ncbi:MAG: hypothetical protein CM15mP82_8170 [Methanobacteriota archaeon]|nr:MAG: hypothetical protein CM15mP82_8170 [Euryarchaeota archaeon]
MPQKRWPENLLSVYQDSHGSPGLTQNRVDLTAGPPATEMITTAPRPDQTKSSAIRPSAAIASMRDPTTELSIPVGDIPPFAPVGTTLRRLYFWYGNP